MKGCSIRHFMRVYIFVEVKKDLQTKIQYCFEINKRTPLDIYNGSSQVDCIKPEGRIHCKQRIKQCVNFSGSKTMTPSEAMQNNQAIMFGLISWYMKHHLPVQILPVHLNLTTYF